MSDLTKGDHQRQRIHATDGVMPTLGAEVGRGHNVPSILPGASRAKPEGDEQLSLLSILSVGDSPAKTSRWQEGVRDWQENGQDFGGSSIASLVSYLPPGFSSRMSLACCPATKDGTWPSSFTGWKSWGTGGVTGFLTANISESRNAAAASLLSDILEESVDPKYFLSPKACAGILRRSEKRGKKLPERLEKALKGVVSTP